MKIFAQIHVQIQTLMAALRYTPSFVHLVYICSCCKLYAVYLSFFCLSLQAIPVPCISSYTLWFSSLSYVHLLTRMIYSNNGTEVVPPLRLLPKSLVTWKGTV